MPDLATEQSYGYNTRTLHRAFDRVLQGLLAQHGVKNSHWYLLRILWEQEGLTQRELSEEINLTESSTLLVLKQMIAEGLIRKSRDKSDQRKLRIYLTPRAKRLKNKLLPIARQVNEQAAAGISKKELQVFNRVAARMRENLRD